MPVSGPAGSSSLMRLSTILFQDARFAALGHAPNAAFRCAVDDDQVLSEEDETHFVSIELEWCLDAPTLAAEDKLGVCQSGERNASLHKLRPSHVHNRAHRLDCDRAALFDCNAARPIDYINLMSGGPDFKKSRLRKDTVRRPKEKRVEVDHPQE